MNICIHTNNFGKLLGGYICIFICVCVYAYMCIYIFFPCRKSFADKCALPGREGKEQNRDKEVKSEYLIHAPGFSLDCEFLKGRTVSNLS